MADILLGTFLLSLLYLLIGGVITVMYNPLTHQCNKIASIIILWPAWILRSLIKFIINLSKMVVRGWSE